MAPRKLLPEQQRLQEALDYDPLTGSLVWRVRPLSHFKKQRTWLKVNSEHAGKSVGGLRLRPGGYLQHIMYIDIVSYVTSRIIWKLVTGEEPVDIDHKNNEPSDLRWENLRNCSGSQNAMNRKVRQDSLTGFRGVTFYKDGRKNPWKAWVCAGGTSVHLGFFATAEDAYAAYCAAAKTAHGEFHHK